MQNTKKSRRFARRTEKYGGQNGADFDKVLRQRGKDYRKQNPRTLLDQNLLLGNFSSRNGGNVVRRNLLATLLCGLALCRSSLLRSLTLCRRLLGCLLHGLFLHCHSCHLLYIECVTHVIASDVITAECCNADTSIAVNFMDMNIFFLNHAHLYTVCYETMFTGVPISLQLKIHSEFSAFALTQP
jgi:hypothetical protein